MTMATPMTPKLMPITFPSVIDDSHGKKVTMIDPATFSSWGHPLPQVMLEKLCLQLLELITVTLSPLSVTSVIRRLELTIVQLPVIMDPEPLIVIKLETMVKLSVIN